MLADIFLYGRLCLNRIDSNRPRFGIWGHNTYFF